MATEFDRLGHLSVDSPIQADNICDNGEIRDTNCAVLCRSKPSTVSMYHKTLQYPVDYKLTQVATLAFSKPLCQDAQTLIRHSSKFKISTYMGALHVL